MARKKKYLNNSDMLKEIHLSKISYCKFADKANDHQEDYIVESVEAINQTANVQVSKDEAGEPIMGDVPVIELARAARAKRLTKLDIPTLVEDVLDTDLVFRVMTTEHIPLVPKKKAKKKPIVKKSEVVALFEDLMDEVPLKENEAIIDDEVVEMVPMRCKFPPFFHYRIDEQQKPYIVGKSHWKGNSIDDGEFSMEHGQTTGNLAMMYIKLCERYGTRSNWRGYCIPDNVEALTKRGWLSESDINTDDEILSYDDGNMRWSAIKSIFRDHNYNGMMHSLSNMHMDYLATPGHKLVTNRGLVPIEYVLGSDRVILMGEAEETSFSQIYSDAFVELLGWIVTEGTYQLPKKSIQIYQNAGPYADRIRNCLIKLDYGFSEAPHGKSGVNICFSLRRPASAEIFKILPEKNLNMDFITSLTRDQRFILIDTMIDGDGHRLKNYKGSPSRRYDQKCSTHMDLFQALCSISGYRTHNYKRLMENYSKTGHITMNRLTFLSKNKNTTNAGSIDFNGGLVKNRGVNIKNKHNHPNKPTTPYQGTVWCPETEYGCFLARRNGKVYLTGNTYNDEMQGQALLQLSQIGLQFNELKSQNPFAYYTAAVTNSFTRVLNIEKKMQMIRDDILEANGLSPSWTRQFENDKTDTKYLDDHGILKEDDSCEAGDVKVIYEEK